MQEAKAKIRKKMRALESTLTEEYLRESNEKVFEALISCEEYKNAERIFMYYSVGREVDTVRVLRHALGEGKTVALPKITGKGTMVPVVIRSESELSEDKYGIPAPTGSEEMTAEDIDLVIVPGAAFSRDGRRLGRGGGYYDRFLGSCPATTVALARKHMVLSEIPAGELDISVHILITD